MAVRLEAAAADFPQRLEAVLTAKRQAGADVDRVVADILADVMRRGDEALIAYTQRFDRLALTADTLRIGAAEIDGAVAGCAPEACHALRVAAERIRSFHDTQKPADRTWTDETGVQLGWRWTPVSSAGLYVPGGTAAYPSSVLMNAIPAKVAGVERLAMVVPAPDGVLNPLVLAAARIAGVEDVFRVGGAQAIAALAFGTATIAAVDRIVGPGNAYVASAKRQVFGTVGVDMVAGPSEVLIVADSEADPAWIAIDLLAQAEHDPAAQSILITDDAGFADAVAAAVDHHLATLARRDIAAASWRDHGCIIVVADLADAPPLVDRFAPEHLQLAVADPEALMGKIRHAGAIFLGRLTPEAIGDYVAGPNHVLPTSGSARYASGLGVLDFMKRTTLIGCDAGSLAAIGPAAVTLAEAEGLDAHARSVAIRLNRPRQA